MSASIDYERRALNLAEVGMYQAAQVFATLSLAAATREKVNYDSPAALSV